MEIPDFYEDPEGEQVFVKDYIAMDPVLRSAIENCPTMRIPFIVRVSRIKIRGKILRSLIIEIAGRDYAFDADTGEWTGSGYSKPDRETLEGLFGENDDPSEDWKD